MKRSSKACSLCSEASKDNVISDICESCTIIENRIDKIVAAFLTTPQPYPKLDPEGST